MSTTKVSLWKIDGTSDTAKARCYSRVPPSRLPEAEDFIWVPISLIEHTSRNLGGHHIVTLPDWYVEKERL